MKSRYDETVRKSLQQRSDAYWLKSNLAGMRLARWVLLFWIASAMLVPILIALLLWNLPS